MNETESSRRSIHVRATSDMVVERLFLWLAKWGGQINVFGQMFFIDSHSKSYVGLKGGQDLITQRDWRWHMAARWRFSHFGDEFSMYFWWATPVGHPLSPLLPKYESGTSNINRKNKWSKISSNYPEWGPSSCQLRNISVTDKRCNTSWFPCRFYIDSYCGTRVARSCNKINIQ